MPPALQPVKHNKLYHKLFMIAASDTDYALCFRHITYNSVIFFIPPLFPSLTEYLSHMKNRTDKLSVVTQKDTAIQ